MNRTHSDWINSYMSLTEETEAPMLYKKWCAISVIASCLKRKVWLPWHWDVFPNFYIVLVGPPGGGKGTAMRPIQRMLQDIGIDVCPQSITREAFIRRLGEAATNDTPPEGIDAQTIVHSSMTVHAAELAVFIPRGQERFLSDLTDIYDCQDPWRYHTKHQGSDDIVAVWLNILGGSTPALLRVILPIDTGIGGGMTSRMIFIHATGREKPVPFPFLAPIEDTELFTSLKEDLEQVHMLRGNFKVDKTYLDAWEPFYIKDFNTATIDDPNFSGYNRRRATHIMKLCMILSASRSNSMVMTGEDLTRAISLIEEAEETMASAFAGYGRSDIAEILPDIMRYIMSHKRVTFNELMGKFLRDVSKQEMESVVMSLKATGFCRQEFVAGKMVVTFVKEI